MCLHELKSEAPIKDICYGYILFIKVQLNPYLKADFIFVKNVFEISFLFSDVGKDYSFCSNRKIFVNVLAASEHM